MGIYLKIDFCGFVIFTAIVNDWILLGKYDFPVSEIIEKTCEKSCNIRWEKWKSPSEDWKKTWLFRVLYIGDVTTQLCGQYYKLS